MIVKLAYWKKEGISKLMRTDVEVWVNFITKHLQSLVRYIKCCRLGDIFKRVARQWLSVSCEKGRNRLRTFDEPTACFLTGADVVLFCVRADFSNDEVCMSFSGENGVRSILLNGKVQLPVLQVQLA